MTEMRILEILTENDVYPTDKRIAAMKQAVNEAIEECVDRADVKQNTAFKYVWEVDIDKLLNLKVK